MANSREALFQSSELELTYYRLTKREEKRLRLEVAVKDLGLIALSDHETLSMPLLEDEETNRQFALLILKLLVGRAREDVQRDK